MAVRLHLTIGVVPDQDRLESSPDTVLVTEPAVGSTLRSKGSLYTVVTAPPDSGGRPDQASGLVADTVRREYYYDESAGIPICLEKAIRSANKRLRHQREGHGVARGSIGVVVGVIRGNELYVATVGDAEAYLVRQARLLTLPDDDRGEGLPTPDDVRVHVWRGELEFGDSLLLVARNVTRTVGTEEIKNSLVTLHPQSAVEHLHHLFVAGGGEGSDALLAVEATEVAATRMERRFVPVRPAEPLAGAPDRSPIPLADEIVDAAAAVQGRAHQARSATGRAFARLVRRTIDRLPRRRTRYRRVVSGVSRRDTQRRFALAFLALLVFVTALALAVVYLGPGRGGVATDTANAADTAMAKARSEIQQVFGNGTDLVTANPDSARNLLRDAYAQLALAETSGVKADLIRPLRDQTVDGLNRIYKVGRNATTTVFAFDQQSPGADLRDLVEGPDGAAYTIDDSTKQVIRVDLAKRTATVVVKVNDGPGQGIGEPWRLAAGGPDLLVIDKTGALWRWRPSNTSGQGTLNRVRVGGDTTWGPDVTDFATYLTNPDAGLYRFYVVDPKSRQILRYLPAADGSGFPSAPAGYLVTAADVTGYRQLFIDAPPQGDIYALTSDKLIRFDNGQATAFALQVPDDDADLRKGHDYALVTGSDTRRAGRLYVWDRLHKRILSFNKATGKFVEQFIARAPTPAFDDLRGMFIVDRPGEQAPALIWITANRMLSSPMVAVALPAPAPSATPRGSGGASQVPGRSPSAVPSRSAPAASASPRPSR